MEYEYESPIKTNYFWELYLVDGQQDEIEVCVQSVYDEELDEHDVTCVTFDCAEKEDDALLPTDYMGCILIGDKLMKKAGYRLA